LGRASKKSDGGAAEGSIICHPAVKILPPVSQTKLVLDTATLEGLKAKLTWVVVISQDSLTAKTVSYLRNNWTVSWPEVNTRLYVAIPAS